MNQVYLFTLFLILSSFDNNVGIASEKVRTLKPRHGYCGNLENLIASSNTCEQNGNYIEKAQNCLERLEAEIKSAGIDLKTKLKANSETQAKNLKNNSDNLNFTEKKLDQLLDHFDIAIDDINYYLANIAQPEDIDDPNVTGDDPVQYAMKMPCFGPIKTTLEKILDQMIQSNLKIETLKMNSNKLSQKSLQLEKGLVESDPTVGKIGTNKAASGPSGFKKNSSTVSTDPKKLPKK